MRVKQIFFMILLVGVISYFIIKFIPTLEKLMDEGMTVVLVLIFLIGIGYLVYRVIRE